MKDFSSSGAIVTQRGKQYVVKRDGRKEDVYFDKITSRIQKLCYGLNAEYIDPVEITIEVIRGLVSGITTAELDDMAAQIAARKSLEHPDYGILAARIAVSNLHKKTKKSFSEVITDLYNATNEHTEERSSPMVSDLHYTIISKHADTLNSAILYDRDFSYNYLAFKTLEESYLLKIGGKVVERPQHMLMRVAVGIHGEDIKAAIQTYNLLSEKYFVHATPTLRNAATPRPHLSNSFLVAMKEDSIDGIFETLTSCALITKTVGDIGLHIHCIRAANSYIAGTNGVSNGLVPMLRVYDSAASYVKQGGTQDPGAFAIHLELWHADIFDVIDLRKNSGNEEERARELSYALWIPDEFMRRVEDGGKWSLMCPNKCPGLSDSYGEEFDNLYKKYEAENRYVRQVEARKLWSAVLSSQMETGMPYMLYKDACNRKSNQQNVGVVKSGDFGAGIVAYTAPDEVAVCCTASIALNMFVKPDKSFDFSKLKEITKVVSKNLDKIIDISYYPLPEAERSSARHRPIAIGVQGFADALLLMKLPFESKEAQSLNVQIFETIYYGALEASCELAEQLNAKYETYEGSPISEGKLQYDLWKATPTALWNWAQLKEKIQKYGVRNALLVAGTSDESTAHLLGNNESFEPYTSNVFTRTVLSKDYQYVNPHLLRDLVEQGLWNDETKSKLLNGQGSVQDVNGIPEEMKQLYKTAWEIKQKIIIKMAADRGPFIDQSQCLNVYMVKPNVSNLSSMHFDSWKLGLKTGMFRLQSKTSAAKGVSVRSVTEVTNGEKHEANGDGTNDHK